MSQRKVTDIMWGLSDIAMLPASDTLTEALIKVHLDMHTRFPVYEKEGDPQSIIGYLNFKDIVNAIKLNPQNPSVRGITRPIKKLPSDTTLSEALSGMMREKAHIALVISKQWEVLGMLTLEDIIEDLVGEIEDEFDRLPTHVHPCGTGWIVGGGRPHDLDRRHDGSPGPPNGPSGKPPVLAEWLHQRLGRESRGRDPRTGGPTSRAKTPPKAPRGGPSHPHLQGLNLSSPRKPALPRFAEFSLEIPTCFLHL
jgi:putative hemolysin